MAELEVDEDVANINEISDKELVRIFSLLPLPSLVPVDFVCRRWHRHQRTVCADQSQLTLYVSANRRTRIWSDVHSLWYATGRTFHPSYQFADGAFPVHDYLLNKREAAVLKTKFPAVNCLAIYGLVFSFDSFSRLIQNWAPSLETLFMVCDDFADGPVGSAHSIWNGIWKLFDSLPKLKHLALPHEIRLDRLWNSAIIRRVESLQIPIGIDTNCKQLVSLFRAISANRLIRKLTITNILKEVNTDLDDHEGFFDLNKELADILEQRPAIFRQITHLGWHFLVGYPTAGVDLNLLTFLCDHFISLTHLDINVSVRFVDLVPQLAKLQCLTSLRLVGRDYLDDPSAGTSQLLNGSDYERSDTEHFEPSISTNPQKAEYKADYDRQYKCRQKLYFFFGLTPRFYKDELTPLTNLTSLHLSNLSINRWEAFDYLRYVFPSIKLLNLEHCELVLKRMNSKRFTPRRKLLLEKLRLFPKLEKVYRNNVLLLEMGQLKNASQVKNTQVEKTLVTGKLKDFFKVPKVPKDTHTDEEAELSHGRV